MWLAHGERANGGSASIYSTVWATPRGRCLCPWLPRRHHLQHPRLGHLPRHHLSPWRPRVQLPQRLRLRRPPLRPPPASASTPWRRRARRRPPPRRRRLPRHPGQSRLQKPLRAWRASLESWPKTVHGRVERAHDAMCECHPRSIDRTVRYGPCMCSRRSMARIVDSTAARQGDRQHAPSRPGLLGRGRRRRARRRRRCLRLRRLE
mmetsp:Transcript_30781/g.92299  ORF Transcript_30781/g.92299 Transcript_30781/m.92299 type:complete len:206 (+) Transcript_30781:93-710(+)